MASLRLTDPRLLRFTRSLRRHRRHAARRHRPTGLITSRNASAALVSAASASRMRHAARSRGPTTLETVRSSANGAPARLAADGHPESLHRLGDPIRPAGEQRRRALRGAGHGRHRQHLAHHRVGEGGPQGLEEARIGLQCGCAEAQIGQRQEAVRRLRAEVGRRARRRQYGGTDLGPTGEATRDCRPISRPRTVSRPSRPGSAPAPSPRRRRPTRPRRRVRRSRAPEAIARSVGVSPRSNPARTAFRSASTAVTMSSRRPRSTRAASSGPRIRHARVRWGRLEDVVPRGRDSSDRTGPTRPSAQCPHWIERAAFARTCRRLGLGLLRVPAGCRSGRLGSCRLVPVGLWCPVVWWPGAWRRGVR